MNIQKKSQSINYLTTLHFKVFVLKVKSILGNWNYALQCNTTQYTISMQQEKYKVYQDLILFNAENKQHILSFYISTHYAYIVKKNISCIISIWATSPTYNNAIQFCAATGCAHPKQNVKFLFIHI